MFKVQQSNLEQFNCDVISPDKVKINIQYIQNWSLSKDIKYILQTFTAYDI